MGGRYVTGWKNDRAARAASDATYYDPLYRKNRAIVLAKAKGRCNRCGKPARLQVDHIINRARGGTHALSNLQALCPKCHASKTGREGHTAASTADPEPTTRTTW